MNLFLVDTLDKGGLTRMMQYFIIQCSRRTIRFLFGEPVVKGRGGEKVDSAQKEI